MEQNSILVVDDEYDVVFPLINSLEAKHYKVLYSKSGKEALNLLNDNNIIGIILDVMLPDYNGFQLCRKLRNQEKLKKIPIIMLTARENSDYWSIEAGADIYISKPYRVEDAVEKIIDIISDYVTINKI